MTTVAGRPARIDSELYRSQGFVLVKQLFRSEEVEHIRAEAKEIFAAQMLGHGLVASTRLTEEEFEAGMYRLFAADLQTFANCGKQAQHLISLHRLSLDERITDRLRELGLGFPTISTRPVLYFNAERLAKKEVYWRLSAHQDWRSMQGSLDSVVVWLPLIDLTTDLGALEVAPGSHARGLQAADLKDGYGQMRGQFDAGDFVPVEVERGDALFFSTFLVHRSGTNITESIRWSCHFRYNNLHETTFIERGYPHPYLYRPQEELITPDFPDAVQVARIFARPT
jgi:phytanoyl-CoA hydroxylase